MKQIVKALLARQAKHEGDDATEKNSHAATRIFGMSNKLYLDFSKEARDSRFIGGLMVNYKNKEASLHSVLETAIVFGFIIGWVQAQKKTFKL